MSQAITDTGGKKNQNQPENSQKEKECKGKEEKKRSCR